MTVKPADTNETPGPTTLEAYTLIHGDKEDTQSKEARLDQLWQDFRERIDNLTAQKIRDSKRLIVAPQDNIPE